MIDLKIYKIESRICEYASVNSAFSHFFKKMVIILKKANAKRYLNVKFDVF